LFLFAPISRYLSICETFAAIYGLFQTGPEWYFGFLSALGADGVEHFALSPAFALL